MFDARPLTRAARVGARLALAACMASTLLMGCAAPRASAPAPGPAPVPASGSPAAASPAPAAPDAAALEASRLAAERELAEAARRITILDGRDGGTVPWNDAVDRLAAAEAVFLGETHSHPLGLAVAAALFDDVIAKRPSAALSLEFFERDEQSRLDEYLQGVTDEATFRRRTQRSPGNYPSGHAQMLEAARAAGLPVIASNAPRPAVRLARLEGYERLAGLSAEQRRLFRIPDQLIIGRYRDDFLALMTGMSGGKPPPEGEDAAAALARAESFYRSQQVWDWTMAESMARALSEGRAPVVQVIGRFHSDFDGGTVQALRLLRPGTRIATVSFVNESSATLAPDDLRRADLVIYVGPSPQADAAP